MKTGILLSKMKIALLFVLVVWSCGASAQLFCIPPIISIQPLDNTVCVGDVPLFTVVAVGTGLKYQWQVNTGSGFTNCVNGGVYSGALTSTLQVSPSASMSGNRYRCVISNSCGTAISNSSLMTTSSILALAPPDIVCEGASVTLSASGGLNYIWSTGATTSSTVVTPTSTTTYSVTGTTLAGCTSTTNVTVTVSLAPDVRVSASPSEICPGAFSTLTAEGAEKYQWSTGETTSSIRVSPEVTTEYSVTGTNSLGCSATASVIVTVNQPPQISVIASNPNICSGGFTFLTASGATNYRWSTGETGSRIGVSPTETTIYSVTGTDDKGCSGTTSFTVTIGPLVTATTSRSEMCVGQHAFLSASGATSYVWSTGENTANIVVSPSKTWTYQVTGTDDKGCSATTSVTVVVKPPLSISVTASNPDICSGEFTFLTASGATNYRWSTGETGSRIGVSPTQTTTYSVTGTDDKGCSGTTSYTVTVGPVVTATTSRSEMCVGQHAFLSASGATSYVWSTGENTANIVVSPSKTWTYEVTGTDDRGCSTTASVTVVVKPALSISVTSSNPDICSGGFTFLTATGATNYRWSTGETGSRIGVSPTQTTTYSVTGTDDNGCSGTTSFTVTVGPVVTATTSRSEMCVGQHAFLSASGATSYVWSTGETTATIVVSPSQTWTYEVTGTDARGCSSTASVTVNVIDCSSSSSARTGTVQADAGPVQENAIRPAVEEISFSLYPNPTKGIFYIRGGPAGAITEVFNSMGQRVILQNIGDSREINLTPYSNGVYLVKVKHQGISIYNARVSKE